MNEARLAAGPLWRPAASRRILALRAELMARIRRHFADSAALEIDPPVLQSSPNGDPGIRPLVLETGQGRRWLATSPEHPLKRLVAAGYGAVWSLTPVFRADEHGPRHRGEFRMLEWYRPGATLDDLIDETLAVLRLACGQRGAVRRLSYRSAFRAATGVDPLDDAAIMAMPMVDAPPGLSASDKRDLLMATRVEPSFDTQAWTVIHGFPPAMAAQACIGSDEDGRAIAERYEIYSGGLELANGYHELDDAAELRRRLLAQGAEHADPLLLAALDQGLGPCCGVAVGFDRLVMLAAGLDDIADAMAFPWERA